MLLTVVFQILMIITVVVILLVMLLLLINMLLLTLMTLMIVVQLLPFLSKASSKHLCRHVETVNDIQYIAWYKPLISKRIKLSLRC